MFYPVAWILLSVCLAISHAYNAAVRLPFLNGGIQVDLIDVPSPLLNTECFHFLTRHYLAHSSLIDAKPLGDTFNCQNCAYHRVPA